MFNSSYTKTGFYKRLPTLFLITLIKELQKCKSVIAYNDISMCNILEANNVSPFIKLLNNSGVMNIKSKYFRIFISDLIENEELDTQKIKCLNDCSQEVFHPTTLWRIISPEHKFELGLCIFYYCEACDITSVFLDFYETPVGSPK